MKCIRRYILNALTVLSLVPCIATAAIWVRSYFVGDSISSVTRLAGMAAYETADDTDLVIASGRARYVQSRCDDPAFPSRSSSGLLHSSLAPPYDVRKYAIAPSRIHWDRFGFVAWSDAWTTARPARAWRTLGLIVPLWFPTTLAALLPASLLLLHARPKSRAGHCPHCGYDLRATPDRCPECGSVPAKGAA